MIWQLEHLNDYILEKIAYLIEKIEEKTFTPRDYISYIIDNFDGMALFVLILDKKIAAYLHVAPPHPLDKTTGYIAVAVAEPDLDQRWADELLNSAERWMYLHGAEKWYMDTTRNEKAWARRYKLGKINSETQMGRRINA